MTILLDQSDVLETLHRDGIYLLEGVVLSNDVETIKSDVEWLLTQYVKISPSKVSY